MKLDEGASMLGVKARNFLVSHSVASHSSAVPALTWIRALPMQEK
jgi:hypothetical protein